MAVNPGNNLGLKIISVLLALLLWAYIANQNQGIASQHTTGVSLRYTNLGEGLVVSGPERVAVKLWGSFRETAEVEAYVDLHGLGEGSYLLPVRVQNVQGAMFASVQPDKVEVSLKRTTRHEFKLGYQVAQSPPPGYELLDVVFVPDRCLVTGDEYALKQVKRVISSLELGNTKESTTSKVRLTAIDAGGKPVQKGIRITPEQAEAYTVVVPKLASKKVAVNPILQGKLPEGSQVQEVRVDPASITLRGNEEAIAYIDEVGTAEISLEGHKQTFSQEVAIQELQDVKTYPSRVLVEVIIANNSEEVTQ